MWTQRTQSNNEHLDDPSRYDIIRDIIQKKPGLKKFYQELYKIYQEGLSRCSENGDVIELGSGAGFVKDIIPEIITSDVLPYENVDQVVDATDMPFNDNSLKAILMANVFHHIPDVSMFLSEACRCLKPCGRIIIIDQHNSWFSKIIFKYFHDEPFCPDATNWKFDSTGPLSGANGSLAWIVFKRDYLIFRSKFPNFKLVKYKPHSPLRYWLLGGLKKWSLLPAQLFGLATFIDNLLLKINSGFGCFVTIEIVKTE
jgi:SAM-dependent methyltransferase